MMAFLAFSAPLLLLSPDSSEGYLMSARLFGRFERPSCTYGMPADNHQYICYPRFVLLIHCEGNGCPAQLLSALSV